MAILKDTVVTSNLRATSSLLAPTGQFKTLQVLSATNATSFGVGTNNQVIRSNGTNSYWASLGAAADYAVDDATANGALGTGTGLTTERSVYYGLVTVNNASQTRATGIYAPTSAGAANQILVSSGGTSAPIWKATAAGAAYATSNNGALTFGTLDAGYGGTGQSTYTIGDILYSNAANTLTKLNGNTTTTNKFLRSVATTSGTAVAPTWSEVTKTDVGLSNVTNDAQVKASLGTAKGDMLYWSANATPARLAIGTAGYFLKATADGPVWANTTDITALGTITTGTWQGTTVGTGYGGTGVASHTANRLVWSTSATAIQATDAHYVSATQMSINFTSAPHSGYTLLVGGHSEINGALSLQQPNSSTQSLYFKNHTSTVLSVGARIYWWNGSASGITHSQLNFQEYSYSTTASATPLSFYEQYSLPDCDANLSVNKNYNIITEKNLTDITKVGTITSGTWNGSTLGIAYGGTGQTTVGNAYMALLGRGGLPSGITSLDDIKTCGCYWINSTDCPNGWPDSVSSGNYACVEVVGTGMPGVIIQRINLYSSSTFFSRMWANSRWYDWNYNISSLCNSNLARTIKSDLYVGADARASSVKLTRADKAVGFEIYEDFGRALTSTDYSISQNLCGFLVHSYSTNIPELSPTPCNLLSYSENYYFPPVNPDLTASVAYYILTTKQYPSAISGRAVPSGATFDTMLTAGVYNIANNCSGYPTTSGTNYNYGILLVATTASPNGSQSNMFQLYLGGTTNASYYKLWIRSRYNKNWKDWKQITLAS